MTRGRPTVIPPESVLMFRVDDAVTINTEQSPVAFQPVSQDDYGNGPDDAASDASGVWTAGIWISAA